MVKKEMSQNKMYLAIVAIVAVVAVVVLVLNIGGSKTAVAGEASLINRWTQIEEPTQKCIGVEGTLLEDESKTYTVDGMRYDVFVGSFIYQSYAGGVKGVKFDVNGETFRLLIGETYTLSNGAAVTLKNMLYQSYAGGVHSATFTIVAP